MTRQPTVFIPHGGGPCFFMDPPPDNPTMWVPMAAYLRGLLESLPQRPAALLIISGHWEMQRPTVLASANPPLLYDYYNFPPHTYKLTYPAPGAPALAERVRGLLAEAGIESGEERDRGYDHGVFIPMKVAFPDADIPILQLSLQTGLDPQRHIDIGKALTKLRDENVLIIGSGLSYHNMHGFGDPRAGVAAVAFDHWLVETLCDGPVVERETGLTKWAQAPGGRASHPREEHLIPLMVAVGAATGEAGHHSFGGEIWGKAVSGFQFG